MNYENNLSTDRAPRPGVFIGGGIVAAFMVFGVIAVTMVGCPTYGVYSAQKKGEAELAQAQQNRQIEVARAKAKAEAAEYEAQSEITRATGVAKANTIIGDSLRNNEDYLRYLYVNNLEHTSNQVIYIPTEAGMPILEATRHIQGAQKVP